MAEEVATHIIRDPQIRFDKLTIQGTRIAVWDIATWTNQGWTPERIACEFNLTLGQVYSALSYYYDHREQIDREIEEDDAEFMRLAEAEPTASLTKRMQALMREREAQGRIE